MKRIISKILVSALLPLAAGVAVTAEAPSAEAQVVYYYPPASYVASYRPVYYNGYAHYWYGNRWWYRDHGAWRGYVTEPAYLYGYRGEWGRHYYGWR
jgi:hypothetical protein